MQTPHFYYIITFTKTHIKITEEQRANIIKATAMEVEVNGQIVKQSNIAEILDEHAYFEAHPDKLPQPIRNDFEDKYGDIGNQQIRKPTGKARELMKQGIIAHFTSQGSSLSEAEAKYKTFV